MATLAILSYVFLVLQYRASANNGARELSDVLSGSGGIWLLNNRTLYSSPLMILSIILYRQHIFFATGME